MVREIVLLWVVDVPLFALDECINHHASVMEAFFDEYRKYLEMVRSRLTRKGIEIAALVQHRGSSQDDRQLCKNKKSWTCSSYRTTDTEELVIVRKPREPIIAFILPHAFHFPKHKEL